LGRARKALAAANDTVRAAEETVAKAKTAAGALATLVEIRTAEARQAEERVRRLEEQIAKASGPAQGNGINRVVEEKKTALQAAKEALVRLKTAAALAPDNAALARAVAETDRAVKELTTELERVRESTTSRDTAQ
jgi:beta-glucosidase-like glycosyl hydrolase